MALWLGFGSVARNQLRWFAPKIGRQVSTTIFPDIDIEYYCNEGNSHEINHNILLRKRPGNIKDIIEKYKQLQTMHNTDESFQVTKASILKELSKLPNKTHPTVQEYDNDPYIIKEINKKKEYVDKPLEFSEITRKLNLMRTDQLGHTCGQRSYYFLGELAELEEALVKYTVSKLIQNDFQLISVPDILPSGVIENCGMNVNTDRTQIYELDPVQHGPDLCLSGTAEMSLAGLLMSSTHPLRDLPLKLAAVSRCYRAETSNVIEERGIYRVHQFTKVEMFVVTTPEHSDEMLEYIRDMQERIFTPLDLHIRVLDMPPYELGAPAYRKYDIEAWMPGRNNYGEISSCSNCTDYQSRRLHIKYKNKEDMFYVHTLNGTACAVPRILIAILETHQQPKGKIHIPKCLQPYMNGKQVIGKNTLVPELKILKIKKHS